MTDNKETKQAPAVEAGARDERAAFEAWLPSIDSRPNFSRHVVDGYDDWDVERAWAGWQARAALARASEAAAEGALIERLKLMLSGDAAFCKTSVARAALEQAIVALARASEAKQPTEPGASIYVECCECVECGHIGINDSHDTDAACGYPCGWTGPSPIEDKCPGCQRENVMGAACPKCSGRYSILAEAILPAAKLVSVSASEAATTDSTRERIAQALHYPACWDTAAYPTLNSAVWESIACAKLGCSECGGASEAAAGEPVAYVPVHPRTAPLWANTVPTLDSDRPAQEGCTPADAKMLRAANHGLADENAMLRRRLRPFALLATPRLSWAMFEYGIDGDPEKQTLQAPQMQCAFNRAAEALADELLPSHEPADCEALDLPDWVKNAKPPAPEQPASEQQSAPALQCAAAKGDGQ